MGINCKRKRKIEEDIDHCRTEKEAKRRREEQFENQNFNLMTNVLYTAEEILRVHKRMNTECGPNLNRNVGKLWCRSICFD